MRIIAEKKCDKAEQERDEAKAQVESMINFLKLQGMSDSKIAEIINSKEKNTTESEETVK
jgi:DNA-binding transcriptional regulator YhcF (GntR family)